MKQIIITAIILTIFLSGCVEPNKNEVFIEQRNNETITLYSDSTFTVTGDSGHGSSGTYRTDGETVTFIFTPLGNIKILKRNSTALIDTDGDIWMKK
jgi:hypothetical protein